MLATYLPYHLYEAALIKLSKTYCPINIKFSCSYVFTSYY